ncbi:hypothetical protein WK13_34940 [Burkholderia ubonensis]|nr:hypothetical protein WK13_34940 [Burkholderia ubonensis]
MAAELVLGPMGIPWVKYGYVAVMATWGSVASLLQKFSKGHEANWKLVAVTDVVNGNLAAMLVFLGCEHFHMPGPLEAICFTLGGFGGAHFMLRIYRKFVAAADSFVTKVTGTNDGKTGS